MQPIGHRFGAALLLDPLSVTMSLVVTGVGALIHIYATSYMEHDERFQRFFIYLTKNFSLPPNTVASLYKSR